MRSLNFETNALAALQPAFAEKVYQLIKEAEKLGLLLMLGTTVRCPLTQARLWCRSRSLEEVLQAEKILVKAKAPRLANLLDPKFAALGPRITSRLPGNSWHQWGEAADIYALVGRKAIWDGSTARVTASVAKKLGLYHSTAMKTWEPKSRHWHLQSSSKDSPLFERGLVDSWEELEKKMSESWDLTNIRTGEILPCPECGALYTSLEHDGVCDMCWFRKHLPGNFPEQLGFSDV